MDKVMQGEGFILKRWIVSVTGHSDSFFLASNRGKALAKAWAAYTAAYDVSFREFLGLVKCRRDRLEWPGERLGDQITVNGEPAFYCGNNSQYVQFAYAGRDDVLNAHPYEVEPEEYRPASYRSSRPQVPHV